MTMSQHVTSGWNFRVLRQAAKAVIKSAVFVVRSCCSHAAQLFISLKRYCHYFLFNIFHYEHELSATISAVWYTFSRWLHCCILHSIHLNIVSRISNIGNNNKCSTPKCRGRRYQKHKIQMLLNVGLESGEIASRIFIWLLPLLQWWSFICTPEEHPSKKPQAVVCYHSVM